tara:strand:- start:352 stop:543 length:192 start_codon:yes stop_codon:yes gene_type:complete
MRKNGLRTRGVLAGAIFGAVIGAAGAVILIPEASPPVVGVSVAVGVLLGGAASWFAGEGTPRH